MPILSWGTMTPTPTSSSSSPSNGGGGVVHEHHERTPLFISSTPASFSASNNSSFISDEEGPENDSSRGDGNNNNSTLSSRGGSATVLETIVNLAKTCMGTGCLALPFAAQQGGLLLFIFGTYGIAAWNCYAVQRLCQSGDVIRQDDVRGSSSTNQNTTTTTSHDHDHDSDVECIKNNNIISPPPSSSKSSPFASSSSSLSPPSSFYPVAPPPGTGTLGKVAWYALGPMGLIVVDSMMVILLFGIAVTYQNAIQSFLHDTPFTTGWKGMDAMIVAMIVAPLSIVPDLGYLAKASAFGLTVLGFAMTVIAGNGILFYDSGTSSTSLFSSLHWLPSEGLAGISHWFGCLVFGFGVVPLTFNFQESMSDPTQMIQSTQTSLFSVASLYIGAGIFLSILYPNIPGDVLHQLPSTGIIPILTRLAMVLVILATTPLLIVPCAELLEGKILHQRSSSSRRPVHHQFIKVVVRFGISFTTAGISVGIPGFVEALSFVGCFCVALVSFCIPPLLHFVLLLRGGRGGGGRPQHSKQIYRLSAYSVDVIMLLWGLTATCITTVTTLNKMTAAASVSSSDSP